MKTTLATVIAAALLASGQCSISDLAIRPPATASAPAGEDVAPMVFPVPTTAEECVRQAERERARLDANVRRIEDITDTLETIR